MAIPLTPTLEEICRRALRGAGQPAPSQGMIQEAMNYQFMEVKNEIKLLADTHPLLLTKEVQVTTKGVRSQAQPTKAGGVKSILLLDGPDTWRGTAQAGAAGTITLASTFSEEEDTLIGLMIFTLSGTGSLQYRHITAYNDTTKVLSISPNWTTTPSSDTTYVIVNYQNEIHNTTTQLLNYEDYSFAGKGLPTCAAISGETLWFNVSPDKIYPLMWTYYLDLDQLDEDDALHDKILREWRSVITQGIMAHSAVIYDDNRQFELLKVYQFMLNNLKDEALTIEQTVPYDPVIY